VKEGKEAQRALEQVSRHLEHFVASLISHSIANTHTLNTEQQQQQAGAVTGVKKGAGGGVGGSSGAGLGAILTSEHLHKLLDTFKAQRKVSWTLTFVTYVHIWATHICLCDILREAGRGGGSHFWKGLCVLV
jgi:hypothetical protein